MIPPVRCLSSHLTTALTLFRNQHGAEANWLGLNRERSFNVSHITKMVIAEAGSAFLATTATVETFAYSVLMCASLPLMLVSNKPFNYSLELLGSSSFTMIWNFGNGLVFNILRADLPTHESIARCAMEVWGDGRILENVFRVMDVAVTVGWIVLCIFSSAPIPSHPGSLSSITFERIKWLRPEDIHFLINWYAINRVGQVPQGILNRETSGLIGMAHLSYQRCLEGASFIRDFYLRDGQIESSTLELIRDLDASIFHFIVSRCVYIYVFGERRADPVPTFLKPVTQAEIVKLRAKYSGIATIRTHADLCRIAEIAGLQWRLTNYSHFSAENPPSAVLNDVKAASYSELRGSLFLTSCLQRALT